MNDIGTVRGLLKGAPESAGHPQRIENAGSTVLKGGIDMIPWRKAETGMEFHFFAQSEQRLAQSWY